MSASFLLAILAANLVVLLGVWRSFRQFRRSGRLDEGALDLLLSGRGLLARLLRSVFRAVTRSWPMYPLGFLFGLGFDTAVALLIGGVEALGLLGNSR